MPYDDSQHPLRLELRERLSGGISHISGPGATPSDCIICIGWWDDSLKRSCLGTVDYSWHVHEMGEDADRQTVRQVARRQGVRGRSLIELMGPLRDSQEQLNATTSSRLGSLGQRPSPLTEQGMIPIPDKSDLKVTTKRECP